MGGCRLLNVLLGASGAVVSDWKSPQIAVAVAMGIYVAGITWFARQEAVRSSRSQLMGATLVIHGGIVVLLILLRAGWSSSEFEGRAAFALLVVTALIDIRLARALSEPTSDRVQAAVKRLLLAIVLFDATMIYGFTGNATLACGTALLIVPAATLLFIAIYQLNTWAAAKMRTPMANGYDMAPTVEVTGRQFEWRLRYPGDDGILGTSGDVRTAGSRTGLQRSASSASPDSE